MSEVATDLAGGCLICLVQASDSMRETTFSDPATTKIAAAILVVNRVVNELARFAAPGGDVPLCFDVGVFAYSMRDVGKPRLRPLLPGSSSDQPIMPIHSLIPLVPDSESETEINCVEIKPSGGAPARAAMKYTRTLITRWAVQHPGTMPPVIIHCTDGETTDGPISGEVAALTADVPGVKVVECLFRQGAIPSAFVPFPETPVGDLWAADGAYQGDDMTDLKTPFHRFLFDNKLSASRTISQFVRRLWSSHPAQVTTKPPESAIHEISAEHGSDPECPVDIAPARPPRFEMRALWIPKRGNSEAEWEDGFADNSADGVLAVADGASDGIFTKLWVDLLLKSFSANPIALDDISVADPWLQERRREWFQAIRYPNSAGRSSGRWTNCAAATFFAFRLDPPAAEVDAPPAQIGWTAWAVGDICLFHIREGRLIASFPIAASADFNLTPTLYQSKAMRPLPEAKMLRGELLPGDLVIFATDATAQGLLVEVEAGNPPDWERYWDIDQGQWRQEIEALRNRNRVVNDDCTLIVLRLPGPYAETVHKEGPSSADEPLTPPTSTDSETAAPIIDALTGSGESGIARGPALEPESAASCDDESQPHEADSYSAPIEPSHLTGEQP